MHFLEILEHSRPVASFVPGLVLARQRGQQRSFWPPQRRRGGRGRGAVGGKGRGRGRPAGGPHVGDGAAVAAIQPLPALADGAVDDQAPMGERESSGEQNSLYSSPDGEDSALEASNSAESTFDGDDEDLEALLEDLSVHLITEAT